MRLFQLVAQHMLLAMTFTGVLLLELGMYVQVDEIYLIPCVICCSAYDVTIPAEGKALVKTDIAIAVPEGCYGRVGMC